VCKFWLGDSSKVLLELFLLQRLCKFSLHSESVQYFVVSTDVGCLLSSAESGDV